MRGLGWSPRSAVQSCPKFSSFVLTGGYDIEQLGLSLLLTLRKDKDRRMAPSFSSSALPHQDTRDTNLDFAVAKDTLLYSGKANSLCAYRAGSDQVFHKARRRMDGLELAFEIIHMGAKMLRAQWAWLHLTFRAPVPRWPRGPKPSQKPYRRYVHSTNSSDDTPQKLGDDPHQLPESLPHPAKAAPA